MKALIFLATGLAVISSALGGDDSTSSVKLSQLGKPAVMKIYVAHGELTVRGEDGIDTVTVRSDAVPDKPSVRKDGLRVISTAASYTLTEKDNVVNLDYGSDAMASSSSADFKVTVPQAMSVVVSTGWGGEVRIENVDGDVEVKNLNGEIVLKELGGGALVESMNGEISASFKSTSQQKPLSFTSMNGEISLRIPAETKANVRFRTQNGSILTDFDEEALKTKTDKAASNRASSEIARAAADVARASADDARAVADEVRAAVEEVSANDSDNDHADNHDKKAPRAPRPPRAPRAPSIPPMAGGKVVSGTLNGGGPDIQIATMNGDIVVRKTQP